MTETLARVNQQDKTDPGKQAHVRPSLTVVPDLKDWRTSVAPPEYDEHGTVIRPAIDVETGRMANGQPLSVFYDRGRADDRHPDRAAIRALFEASKMIGRV